MHLGPHHQHVRRRIYLNFEKFPPSRRFVRVLDMAVYVAGFLGPLLTVPQIYLIYVGGDATGVSPFTWAAYMIFNLPWIVYGIVHKESVISFTYTLWFFINGIVLIGALIY